MTLKEARDVLRVDAGANDDLISSLIAALPGYIEVATGMGEEQQAMEPLADTVGGFLLRLWYFSEHADNVKLQRAIDDLLKCLTLKARAGGDGA